MTKKEIDWDAVLPWEVDWNALLPDHQWTPYGEVTWEHVMPPPRTQLSDLLPADFGGSCAVHSFSEALTGMLRIGYPITDISVDLPTLLHLTLAKGILTSEGSSLGRIDYFARNYGIPLEGEIPDYIRDCYNLHDTHNAYAMNIGVYSFGSTPMPFSSRARTAEMALQVIKYRERLCDFLNIGPLVICSNIDVRYSKARQIGQPYCRPRDRWFSLSYPQVGHCVTAYGYRCPGGDVRTLRLLYQDNIDDATGETSRLVMHPDAIDSYHVTDMRNMKLSNGPKPDFIALEPSLSLPKKPSLWESFRDIF